MQYRYTALFAFLFFTMSVSASTLDSLKNALNEVTDDSTKSFISRKICRAYADIREDSIAEQYGLKSLEYAQNINDTFLMGIAYQNLFIAKEIAMKHDESTPYGEKALELFTAINDTFEIGYSNRNLGTMYFNEKKYVEAVPYFYKALNNFKSVNRVDFQALVYIDLGMIFYELRGLEKSLEYYQNAYDILDTCDCLPYLKSWVYNGLGNCKTDLGIGGLEEFSKAFEIAKRNNDSTDIAVYYNNIANYYSKHYSDSLPALEKAYDYYYKALHIFERRPSQHQITGVLINIGCIEHEFGNIAKAKEFLHDGIERASAVGQDFFLRNAYDELAKIAEENGDFEKVLEYTKEVHKYEIGLLGEDKLRAAELQKIQFDNYTVEKENEFLKRENELSSKEMETLNSRNRAFAVIIIIAGIFIIFMFFISGRLRSTNKKLEENRSELLKQQSLISDMSLFKSKIISVIGHDLRGYLANVSSLGLLLKENPSDKELLNMLNASNAQALGILNNVVSWVKSQDDTEGIKVSPMNFYDVRDAVLSQVQVIFNEKGQVLEEVCDCDQKIMANPNAMEIIIRNLFTNASKFSPENTKLYISCKSLENKARISITDSGSGIQDSLKNRILGNQEYASSLGTNREKGTGIGLQIVIYLLEQMGSKLQITNTPNKGACFYFDIPLYKGEEAN